MNATTPAAPAANPLFVDVPHAARLLGLGTTKVWQMVYANELPSRRFGRAVRIPIAALQQLADVSNPVERAEF